VTDDSRPAPHAHHLRVQRTARYYTLGGASPALSAIWFLLHGYGQLAGTFIRYFSDLASDDSLLVAPEAMNRFYLASSEKATGAERPVGASWMTREDRASEIADYVEYLDALYDAVSESASGAPPAINVISPIILGAPNHQYQDFAMTDFVTAASDSCSLGLGIADVVITQITSDEVENGCGDGNTLDDIVIGANCRTAQLRVERSGCGNGRVYTVFLHVTDLAGNRTATTVQVLVPPNNSSNAAVDDGPNYTVVSTCP